MPTSRNRWRCTGARWTAASRSAGTSFQQVLDRVRLAMAKELLQESTIALVDITAALGYADDVSFIRAFRRWTGTTPGAWRDSAR